MKCDECLPLIEEYADGELEAAACELVSTHLAACLECSEAFDALVGEQELYARYVRDVEVTPAMWESVRAEVFKQPASERVAPPLPLLARLRGRLDAAFGGLRWSPALAGALALLVVGVAAGVVAFVQLKDDTRRTDVASVTNVGKDSGSTRGAVVRTTDVEKVEPAASGSTGRDESQTSRLTETTGTTQTRAARVVKAVESGGARSLPVSARREGAIDAGRLDDGHAVATNEDPLLAPSEILVDPDEDPIRKNARALNVEEREVARHIERAQMLLLSFRNVRLAEGVEGEATGDVAYERRLSRELLDRNVSLRINAELAGNLPARQVLDSLEPFLLDIANIKDDSSHDEVRSIKERIQKDEIIAALQVY